MKIGPSIHVEDKHINAPVDSQTLLDILNVLETRHDLVNEQWHALRTELAALHEERALNIQSQRKMSDRSLLMEQELSRYQRFFHILRQTLLRRRIHNTHFSANCEG